MEFVTGTRVAWWSQPKREKGRCTGTVLGWRHSPRTGWEWVVDVDGLGGRRVVVRPANDPVELRPIAELKKGDHVRFPATEETGRVHTEFADGFLYILADVLLRVPAEPNDEVEMVP